MKKTLTTVLLTAIIVGAPLGYIAFERSHQLEIANGTLQNEENQKILAAQTFDWNGKSYTIEHICDGTIKPIAYPSSGTQVYCVGTNTLELKDSDGKTTTIDTSTVAKDVDAPFLNAIDLIAGNAEGTLLVNYVTDPCASTADCGVGQYPVHEFAVKLSDSTFRLLANIPSSYSKDLVWNSTGTKALIAVSTVGGTGYSEETLQGYDLATDTVKALSVEKAAFSERNLYTNDAANYTDVNGTVLSHWDYISSSAWTDDSHFKVKLYAPDGSKKDVTGSF